MILLTSVIIAALSATEKKKSRQIVPEEWSGGGRVRQKQAGINK